jgi:DNA-binding XRE family transcriptional regulator
MPAVKKSSVAADREPTDQERNLVRILAACGITQEDIADALGVSRRVLARRFGAELENGAKTVHAKLAAKAVSMALAGDKTMLCFVLKTKFRWRERDGPGDAADTPDQTAAKIAGAIRAMEAATDGKGTTGT